MALIDRLCEVFPVTSEAAVHPHCPEERAELFHAFDAGSAELEVINFLNALVFLFKPAMCLETGTGRGFTTMAIADGLRRNGFGHLHTVEVDAHTVAVARENMRGVDEALEQYVTFHVGDSMEFIASLDEPFDFVLFDSLVAFRHKEFELMLELGLSLGGAICCFHDTSRTRGMAMHDFNPQMIAGLDGYSPGRQSLESGLSRGFRLLRV